MRLLIAPFALMFTLLAGAVEAAQLLVVHDQSCGEYTRWQTEIAPSYAATPEGRAAPLLSVAADGPWPDGLAIARRPRLSPTFILLEGGVEIARIEGYSDPETFRADLRQMLRAGGIAVAR